MARLNFTKDINTELLKPVQLSDTTIYVKNLEAGFTWPDISAPGDYFYLAVEDPNFSISEIVRCNKVTVTASETVLVVDRGLEDTVPGDFPAGATVDNRYDRVMSGCTCGTGGGVTIVVPISQGGTSANNATDARTNLGVPSKQEFTSEIARLEAKINTGGIANATLTSKGVTQLSSDVNSTDETKAATPKAVKEAYDKAVAASAKATTADALASPRTISISGDGTGSTTFDGSADVDIALTIPTASTASKGLTVLSSSVSSAEETTAATSKAVKTVHDLIQNLLAGSTPLHAATADTLKNARAITLAGDVVGSAMFNGSQDVTITTTVTRSGTASAAKKLETPRDITLTGDVTGTASFDGTADALITTTVRPATTSLTGIVQLNDSITSNSTTTAATANAVKQVYDAVKQITSGGTITTSKYAEQLKTPRTISLTGSATGSTAFNGSTDVSIPVTIPHYTGATSVNVGNAGLVPPASSEERAKFLRGDGAWMMPDVADAETAKKLAMARNINLVGTVSGSTSFDGSSDINIDTKVDVAKLNIPTYSGATSGADGVAGFVPPATTAEKDYFLKGDGSWVEVTPDGGNAATAVTADRLKTPRNINLTGDATGTVAFDGSQSVNLVTTVKTSASADVAKKLSNVRNLNLMGDVTGTTTFDGSADATIATTVATYTGATDSTKGVKGLVPAANAGDEAKVLCGDGTWKDLSAASGSITTEALDKKTVIYQKDLVTCQDVAVNGDTTDLATERGQIGDAKQINGNTFNFNTLKVPGIYALTGTGKLNTPKDGADKKWLVYVNKLTDTAGSVIHQMAILEDGTEMHFRKLGTDDLWSEWTTPAGSGSTDVPNGTKPEVISSDSLDFNTLTNPGYFCFRITSLTNAPREGLYSWIVTNTQAANNILNQWALSASGNLAFSRAYNQSGSSWGAWSQVNNDITHITANGSDFNNFTTPGFYTTQATNMKNAPANFSAWSVYVLPLGDNLQQIATRAAGQNIYVRMKQASGSWTAWLQPNNSIPTQLSTRTSTGAWTISNVNPQKPLYICAYFAGSVGDITVSGTRYTGLGYGHAAILHYGSAFNSGSSGTININVTVNHYSGAGKYVAYQ